MNKKDRFIQQINENEGIIYKTSRVYSNNVEDQKELFQEIVYQLWKSYETFKGDSEISTWMYRVALNTSISHLKKEKKREKEETVDSTLLDKMMQVDSLLEERLAILYKHIRKLNIIEKGIILLHLEGKSYKEIAAITGFTSSNIGTRLGRIKQKLIEQIGK